MSTKETELAYGKPAVDLSIYSTPTKHKIMNPYGKGGAFAAAESAISSGGKIDEVTMASLKIYADANGATADEATKAKAASLLQKYEQSQAAANAYGTFDANAKAKYEAQLKAIEEQQRYAEQLAEEARAEGVKNAYAQYDRSRSTYGRNAEQLAQIGLSNSGYSDYLTGVAYSNMVGGVQNAHDTANKAIQDAYYNAGQAKLAAESKYHDEVAAARQAYQDKVASLAAAVGKGEVDAKTAENIANAYGINSQDMTPITEAATAYEDTVRENAKTTLESLIANGQQNEYGEITYPNEKDIKAYGEENGLSEEEINAYIEQNKANVDKVDLANYQANLTTNTSNDEIDKLNVSDTVKADLKKARDEMVYSEETSKLQAEVASGEARGALTDLDEKYANGGVAKDTYQHIYFDRALAFAENANSSDEIDEELRYINSLESTKRLNAEDAKALREYAESRRVVQISDNVPITFSKEKRVGHNGQITIYTLTFDTEEATFKGTRVGIEGKKAINSVVPSPKEGEVVKYDGNVYVYYDSSWKRASSLNEIFDKYAGLYNNSTKPKHTPIKE